MKGYQLFDIGLSGEEISERLNMVPNLEEKKSKVYKIINPPVSNEDYPNVGAVIDYVNNNSSKVGQKTEDGGEIFNLYEPIVKDNITIENKAISSYSHTSGYDNISGSMGYELCFIRLIIDEVNPDNFTLDLCIKGKEASDTLSPILTNIKNNAFNNYKLDTYVSFQWGNNFDLCAGIKFIDYDYDQEWTIISLDRIPVGLDETMVNNGSSGMIWFPTSPEIGNVILGTAAHSSGYGTKAVQLASDSQGCNNISAGEFSSTRNLNNVAGYAADASGERTKALGPGSSSEGQDTEALGCYSHAQNFRTKAKGQASTSMGSNTEANHNSQTVLGTYNLNKEDTLFEVGNGSVAKDRQNAFEVYKDGHAELLTMGDNYKSVATKEYVDNSTAGKKTAGGGEIFNNYNNNKAFGLYSTSRGNSTIAGYLGYNIKAIEGSNCRIFLTNDEEVDESDVKVEYWLTEEQVEQYTDNTFECGYVIGDEITIKVNNFSHTVEIIDIEHNIITVDDTLLDSGISFKRNAICYVKYDGTSIGNNISSPAPSIQKVLEMLTDEDHWRVDSATIYIIQDIDAPALTETKTSGVAKHNLVYWGTTVKHDFPITIKPYPGNTNNIPTYLASSATMGTNTSTVLGGPTAFEDVYLLYTSNADNHNYRSVIQADGNNIAFNDGVKFGHIDKVSSTGYQWSGVITEASFPFVDIAKVNTTDTNTYNKSIYIDLNNPAQYNGRELELPSYSATTNIFTNDVTIVYDNINHYGTKTRIGGATEGSITTIEKNLNFKVVNCNTLRFFEGANSITVKGAMQLIKYPEANFTLSSNKVDTSLDTIHNILKEDGTETDRWILDVDRNYVSLVDFVEGEKGKFKVPSYYVFEVMRKSDDSVKYVSNENGVIDLSDIPGEYKVINIKNAEYYQSNNVIYASDKPTTGNIPQGKGSISDGYNTSAFGDYSHTSGIGTIASERGQTVIGTYNKEVSSGLFIVGNGGSDSTRDNAFVVHNQGHAELKKQGQTSNSVVIKSELDDKCTKLNEKINQLSSTKLTRELVTVLPDITDASESTIYMIPNTSNSEENIYDEYMLIFGKWELIGSTAINLSEYTTKDYIDNIVDNINASPRIEIVTSKAKSHTLTDTANRNMLGIKIIGNTSQDGTPSPENPIPIQCVKQGTKIVIKNGDTTDYEITLPCDLYDGDIWYPLYGVVERYNRIFTIDSTTTVYNYELSGTYGIGINNILEEPQMRAPGYCNYARVDTTSVGDNPRVWFGVNSKHIYWVGILDYLGFSSVEEFKEWLVGKDVTFIYKEVTPIIEQYEPISNSLLKTFKPVTNILNTNVTELEANIEVKYVADTKDYVDNAILQAELGGGDVTVDLSNYVTKDEINDLIEIPSEYVTENYLNDKGYLTEIPSEYVTENDLSNYATTNYVDNKVKDIPTIVISETAPTNPSSNMLWIQPLI